jgi:hypothetical protein
MTRPQPIAASEISVVVQGPWYENLTREVVSSVRRYLPGAEVIYSGWTGADASALSADKVVLSDDPGGRPHPHDPRFFYNTNRQIVSTRAGLQAASHTYAVKLRSDQLLTSARFLEYFDCFPKRGTDYVMFEHRVAVSDIYTINPRRGPYLFHPSDWFHFGQARDLLLLWDLPLAPEPESTEYFRLHPEEKTPDVPELVRYPTEQYNWLHCLRKRFEISCRHCLDFNLEAVRISDLALVNNFIVLELKQIGLSAPRHPFLQGTRSFCYTYGDFVRLYREHCDPGLFVPPDPERWKRDLVRVALRLRESLLHKPSGLRTPAAEASLI